MQLLIGSFYISDGNIPIRVKIFFSPNRRGLQQQQQQ